MSAFVDALRRLDAEASPAPFRHGADYALYDAKRDAVVQYGDEVGPYLGGVNDDLFILLRNAAPEIAEAMDAADDATEEAQSIAHELADRFPALALRLVALRTALSRLDGTVKP